MQTFSLFIVTDDNIIEVEKLLPMTTQAQEDKQDKEATTTPVEASNNVTTAADPTTTP